MDVRDNAAYVICELLGLPRVAIPLVLRPKFLEVETCME